MNPIVSQAFDFMQSRNLLDNQTVILAVSGGADSVCMAYIFAQLKTAGFIKNTLVIAHINHNLRGEDADQDEKYVNSLAVRLECPFESRSVDVRDYAHVNKLSVETAARQLRLKSLEEIAGNHKTAVVATAHHMNDNAETMLHRMARGTGFRGLGGIKPKNTFSNGLTIIRPMLCLERKQIVAFLESEKIVWQHDYTNDETIYTRNYIRHKLLPALEKQSCANLVHKLSDLSVSCQKLNSRIESMTENLAREIEISQQTDQKLVSINLKILWQSNKLIQIEIIRKMMITAGLTEGGIEKIHLENVCSLVERSHGSSYMQLPGNLVAYRKNSKLFIGHDNIRTKISACSGQYQHKLVDIGTTTDFENWKIITKVMDISDCDPEEFKSQKNELIEWFDLNKIDGVISVRPRTAGDKFIPIGMNSEKKIGKFITTAKVDPSTRHNIVIFTDNEKIIWVAPLRASELTKLNADTQKILEIRLSKA